MSKAWCLLLLHGFLQVFLVGCRSGGHESDGFGSFESRKTRRALFACKKIRLVEDFAMRGDFLFDLIGCLSDKKDELDGESLAPLLTLMEKVSVRGVDDTLELMFLKDEKTSPLSYPTLDLLGGFLTRGIDFKKADQLALKTNQRFFLGQNLLKKMALGQPFELLFSLAKSDQLEDALYETSKLLKNLPHGSFEGLTNKFFLDEDYRKNLLDLILLALEKKGIYPILKDLLTIEKATSFSSELHRKDCLDAFLLPRLDSFKELQKPCQREFNKEKTARQFPAYWQKALSDKERSVIIESAVATFSAYKDLTKKERSPILLSGQKAAKVLAKAQTDGFSYFLASLASLRDLKAKDFAPLAEALLHIEDQESFFGTMQEKTAAALLREKLDALFASGGQVNGCKDLYLEKAWQTPFDQTALIAYLTPRTECDMVPPIFAFIFHELKEMCQKAACPHMPSPLKAQDFREQKAYLVKNKMPNEQDLGSLLGVVKENTLKLLREDPYYLVHESLAYDKIEAFTLEEAFMGQADYEPVSLEGFKALAARLQKDPSLKKVVKDDFLVNLAHLEMTKAASAAYQTSNFFPDKEQKDLDHKVARAVRGIYPHSALENAMKERFAYDRVSDLAGSLFSSKLNSLLLKRKLYALSLTDLAFKNIPLDKKKDQDVLEAYPASSERHAISIGRAGEMRPPLFTPLPFENIFKPGMAQKGEPKNHLGMWSLHLKAGPILSLNSLAGYENKIEDFFATTLFDYASAEVMIEDSLLDLDKRDIYEKIMDKKAYSLEEKRALSFYFVRSFIASLVFDLEDFDLSHLAASKRAGIFSGFLNENYFLKEASNWSGFRAVLPTEYFKGSALELGKNLLPKDKLEYKKEIDSIKSKPLERGLTDAKVLKEQPRSIKSLLGLGLVTVSPIMGQRRKPGRYVMPLISLEGVLCESSKKEQIECPIHIRGLSYEDKSDYQILTSLTENLFKETFCVLLDQALFSPDFREYIEKTLKINRSMCHLSQNTKRLYLENGYQKRHLETILKDLLEAGKKRQLKKGLASLTLLSSETAKKAAKSRPILTNKIAGQKRKRSLDYLNFRHKSPSLSNNLINDYIGLQDNSGIRDLLRHIAKKGEHSLRMTRLISLFRKLQIEHSTKESSALLMVLDFARRVLENKDDVKTLSYIMGYMTDLELGDLWGYELPLALSDLYYKNGQMTFDWHNKGHSFIRQHFRRESFQAIAALLEDLSPKDIKNAANLIQVALAAPLSIEQAESILHKSIDFLIDYGFSVKEDDLLMIESFEKALEKLFALEDASFEAFDGYLQGAINTLTSPLYDFKGQKIASFTKIMEGLLTFALTDSFSLFKLYQSHKLADSESEDFLKDMLLGNLKPLAIEDPFYLKEILIDSLGENGSETIKSFILIPAKRRVLQRALFALQKPSRKEWTEALAWLSEISPLSKKRILWLHDNIIWRPDSSKSYRLFFERSSLSATSEYGVLNKQIDLLSSWIMGRKNITKRSDYEKKDVF